MVDGEDTAIGIFGRQRFGKPAIVVSRRPCFVPRASESVQGNDTWIDLEFDNITIGINQFHRPV